MQMRARVLAIGIGVCLLTGMSALSQGGATQEKLKTGFAHMGFLYTAIERRGPTRIVMHAQVIPGMSKRKLTDEDRGFTYNVDPFPVGFLEDGHQYCYRI